MRQQSRRIVAGIAALTIALPAALGPGVAHAKPNGGSPAKCTPGQMAEVTINGDKRIYVCNKKGKWVRVLYAVAGSGGVDAPVLTAVRP
jgi:hypothetical protein